MNNNPQPQNRKESALHKLGIARSNLLLMIIFTAVNIVLFAIGTDTMLLFSATVPYFVSAFGIMSEVPAVAWIGIIIAVVILGIYALCWVFSKKHYGWMIAALVLFVFDSLALAGMYLLIKDASGILDALIHIWVLYYLVIGVKNGYTLKHLSPEEELEYETLIQSTQYTEVTENTQTAEKEEE